MAIICVTRLHLRSLRFFPGFLWYTRRSIRQPKRTPGNLGARVRKTRGLAFWTLAIWRDNQAIRALVPAAPRREAMQKLPHWCDEAAFADWEQDTADWPSWETARGNWLLRDDWLTCCIHQGNGRQANSRLLRTSSWREDRSPKRWTNSPTVRLRILLSDC